MCYVSVTLELSTKEADFLHTPSVILRVRYSTNGEPTSQKSGPASMVNIRIFIYVNFTYFCLFLVSTLESISPKMNSP